MVTNPGSSYKAMMPPPFRGESDETLNRLSSVEFSTDSNGFDKVSIISPVIGPNMAIMNGNHFLRFLQETDQRPENFPKSMSPFTKAIRYDLTTPGNP